MPLTPEEFENGANNPKINRKTWFRKKCVCCEAEFFSCRADNILCSNSCKTIMYQQRQLNKNPADADEKGKDEKYLKSLDTILEEKPLSEKDASYLESLDGILKTKSDD